MTLKMFNTHDQAGGSPAKAGTPCGAEIQPGTKYGVPPSGGGAHANTMTMKTSYALDMADAPPAKAGTPCGAEIQQGMKELEGMLR